MSPPPGTGTPPGKKSPAKKATQKASSPATPSPLKATPSPLNLPKAQGKSKKKYSPAKDVTKLKAELPLSSSRGDRFRAVGSGDGTHHHPFSSTLQQQPVLEALAEEPRSVGANALTDPTRDIQARMHAVRSAWLQRMQQPSLAEEPRSVGADAAPIDPTRDIQAQMHAVRSAWLQRMQQPSSNG